MVTPFYNAVKGTTAGTPGTGAFTPNAASSGFRAWSTIPTGWIGLVRYEDGTAWELAYSYWNGTTLSRASTQVYDSSTGSQLSLTSAATAAMVIDAGDVMSHLGEVTWLYWKATFTSTTVSIASLGIPTTSGTAAAATVAATNYLTEQLRIQITSATTANAQAGWSGSTSIPCALSSTSAGHGGWEFTATFGASQLPTGPRLFVGVSNNSIVASAFDPSASAANAAAFGKDAADTNIQLMTGANSGALTKIDTGIPLVANGWYRAVIYAEPGATKIYALLIRLDTGAIWFSSTTTAVPATGSLLAPFVLSGLSSTTGTAMIFHIGSVVVRGSW